MAIDVKNIPESHRAALSVAYRTIYSDFLKRSQPILDEWNILYPTLVELGIIEPKNNQVLPTQTGLKNAQDVQSSSDFIPSHYDPTAGWLRKSEYVLKAVGRPLTSLEIIDILIKNYEPTINRDRAINSIPATLSVAAKDGKINRTKNQNGEYSYSLKQ